MTVSFNTAATMQAALDTLEDVGHRGITMAELAEMIACPVDAMRNALRRLERNGLAAFREELGDRRTLRRWFLTRYAPRQPVITDPSKVATHRTGTLADPWGVKVAPAAVCSAQCRPWAMAAAGLIGAARG